MRAAVNGTNGLDQRRPGIPTVKEHIVGADTANNRSFDHLQGQIQLAEVGSLEAALTADAAGISDHRLGGFRMPSGTEPEAEIQRIVSIG